MCDLCNVFGCIRGCPNYDEDQDGYKICPSCETHLYNGDVWYPEFGVCEHCIDDYMISVDTTHIMEPEDNDN